MHMTNPGRHYVDDMPLSNARKTEHPVDRSAPWEPVDNWATLRGLDIEIHMGGRLIDQGRVDDVMPDGSLLWLMNDGASGRRIIENLPGTLVRLSSRGLNISRSLESG